MISMYKATGGNFPSSLDLKPHVFEIEDQGPIGACVLNAIISACEQLRPGSYSSSTIEQVGMYSYKMDGTII